MPDLSLEMALGAADGLLICGVDEVGRGPLAGPVVAAAVILPAGGLPEGLANKINDSKKLSEKQREALYPALVEHCTYAVAEATVGEIDKINILHASLLAMTRAVRQLDPVPHHALIDGNKIPKNLPCPSTPVIKGDSSSLSIAAASIIAKVTRDRIMKALGAVHTVYGWQKNAGYGTSLHLEALKTHGVTMWHRGSFAPVAHAKELTK
ncbi:MAG: ribonuclease HII [Proteobacteria bacterium]|jgi:ribonuclease HII|nr:ribonuclease HII [Alphaproteobacteria bacterium]NCC02474.1 ribonuclease HII [Pseudomonadota bacterium]